MARRSSATAVLLLAALVVSASAAAPRHGALFAGAGGEAEQLAANSPAACKTCLVAFRVLDDLLCDPAAEDVLVDFARHHVCPMTPDKRQCFDMARQLAPVAIEWLRTTATPATLCSGVGVCGAAIKELPRMSLAHAPPRDAMECATCQFVVDYLKASLADPATQAQVDEKAKEACGLLPAESLRAGCLSTVAQYEPLVASLLTTMTSQELCLAAGACMGSLAASSPPRPLPAALLAPADEFLRLVAQARRPEAGLLGDTCDLCKSVVLEAHTMLADPTFQRQLTDYAKATCGAFPSYEASCDQAVDQYAPLAFGMALTYLQPDSTCAHIGVCRPSALQRIGEAMAVASQRAFDIFGLGRVGAAH